MPDNAFRYPASDLDRRDALTALLGSFWTDVFSQSDLVGDVIEARARCDNQALVDLNEAADCLGYQTTPVLHTQRWQALTLLESQRNSPEIMKIRYGDSGLVYGDRSYSYGDVYKLFWASSTLLSTNETLAVFEQHALSAFAVPRGLSRVRLLSSAVGAPEVTLVNGIDFAIDTARQIIVFRSNPFEDARLTPETLYSGTTATDRQLTLWMFNAEYDKRYLQNHVAYPLQVTVPSTETAKTYLRACWDAIAEGTTESHIRRILAAVLDISLVQNDEETVELIDEDDPYYLWIVTDKASYKFDKDDTSVVAVGDTVYRDDALTKAIQFFPLNRGELPPAADVPALQITREMLGGRYADALTFVNRTVVTTVTTTDEHTDLRFAIGGWPEDVELFWQETMARGIAKGTTLAEALDVRTTKVGQPVASNLPTTINPLELLIQSHLRYNAYIVTLDLRRRNADALSLSLLRALRWLQPPHTLILIVLQLESDPVEIDPDGAGDSTEPGHALESYVTGIPTAVNLDVEPATYVDLASRLQNMDSYCP